MEEISRKVNLIELITPINVKEQKHIWLERAASKDFSFIPKFDYDQKKLRAATQNIESIFDIKHRLAYIEIDNQKEASMVQLAMNRANNLLSTICMVGSIMRGDDFQTKKIAYGKFGGIDAQASAFAAERALLLHSGDMPSKSKVDSILTDEEINRLESLNFDASEIAYWFLWAIKQYGFDYRLEISQTATAIDVRDSSSNGKPVIVIPVKRRVSGRKLITLLRHEIECHARDSYNGRIMLNGLGGVLRADDDILYEGHAMYEEAQTELRLFGNDSHLPLPWYTIAINMAESGASVEEIANNIYQQRDQSAPSTWTTLYRTLFRGRTQPIDNGYYFSKDKAYLEGYLLADRFKSQLDLFSIGSVHPWELTIVKDICQNSQDLPYPDLNLAEKLAYELLA